MKELLRAGCELLADNRDVINKNFKWDMELMSVAGSVVYTGAGQTADVQRMNACKKILKRYEGIFSSFRSNMEIPALCKMALAEDPEGYLQALLAIYDKLRKGKIFGSEYMALAALSICDGNMASRVDQVIERAKELMARMKAAHPLLTSDEDLPPVALLAMTDKSVDQIIAETEYCYDVMKKKFSFHNNSVQSLSHFIVLGEGSVEEKCAKISAIYDALVVKGISYGKDYGLASLGALADVEMTPEEIASEIADAAAYLKTRKGFGDFVMGKKTRVMFAVLLTAQAYAPAGRAGDASVLGASLSMVIAQELALMTTVAACAASSASGSGH